MSIWTCPWPAAGAAGSRTCGRAWPQGKCLSPAPLAATERGFVLLDAGAAGWSAAQLRRSPLARTWFARASSPGASRRDSPPTRSALAAAAPAGLFSFAPSGAASTRSVEVLSLGRGLLLLLLFVFYFFISLLPYSSPIPHLSTLLLSFLPFHHSFPWFGS